HLYLNSKIMQFYLTKAALCMAVDEAENVLLNTKKVKVNSQGQGIGQVAMNVACVYMFLEKRDADNFRVLFIVQTRNLSSRIENLSNTREHVFRKHVGKFYLGRSLIDGKQFDAATEKLINDFIDEFVYISFIPVNFGRVEIKDLLSARYKDQLLKP